MKKWRIILGMIALTLGIIFTISISNPASASSWHKGTPSAIRGSWKHPKTVVYKGQKQQLGDYMNISKYSMNFGALGRDGVGFKVTKFKTIKSHVYRVACYNDMNSSKNLTYFIFKKVSKNKIIQNYGNRYAMTYTRGKLW